MRTVYAALCELRLNTAELDLLSFGSVNDMYTEKSLDSIEWREEAFQADMDRLQVKNADSAKFSDKDLLCSQSLRHFHL